MAMSPSIGKADYVIQEVAGCGLFQVIFIFLTYFLCKASAIFSIYFLFFSMHNPGWRCLDDGMTSNFNFSNTSRETDFNDDLRGELIFDNCSLFYSCKNIEFDPETSTLVSEWGLLCDRAWIASLIASLQMFGILIGSFLVGYLGDAFGRKFTIYGAQLVVAALNLVSYFSTSWQMIAVVRFFVGIACCANLSLIYMYVAEFATLKWRAAVSGIPGWPIVAIISGLVLMSLKNWRLFLIVTVVLTIVGFVPVVWTPESLRWLEVKGKSHKFNSVAKKITRINGKTLPPFDTMLPEQQLYSESTGKQQNPRKTYILLDLFRGGYRLRSFIVALEWFSCSAWYYTINFGVRTLHGNFYTNFILITICEIPTAVSVMFISNIFKRKFCKLVTIGLSVAMLTAACCFKLSPWPNIQTTGVTVVCILAKGFVTCYWCFVFVQTAEMYPTVVRSLAQNWGNLFARLGGALAPFLMPSDPNSSYISFAAMAVLGVICAVAVLKLPETKGKILKETFDGEFNVDKENYDVGDVVISDLQPQSRIMLE